MNHQAAMFSHAISGSLTESQISNYKNHVTTNLATPIGGWIQQQAEKIADNFNHFLNSRVWEFSKRMVNDKDEGEYVSSFDVGYLGSLNGLQSATGLMRNYIMANPDIAQLYQDELISGYEGEFSPWSTGVGEDNLFYRQSMSGLLTTQTTIVDDKEQLQLKHTHYRDSVSPDLTFRDKVNIQKTWNATALHMAKEGLFDITSSTGEKRKEPE